MLFSLDRISGNRAVLIGEDQKPLEVPLSMLPDKSKSGDMFTYQDGSFSPAEDEQVKRRERVAEMLEILLKQNNEDAEEDDPENEADPTQQEPSGK